MSWFDEQLRYRKQKDDESFENAIKDIAGAVLGKHLVSALEKDEIAQSAIEEILKYYNIKMKTDPLPAKVDTIDEQIEYRMRPFGIMRRTVNLDKGWRKCAVGPMLGTLKSDGSAVALIPGKISGYVYIDVQSGEKVKITAQNEDLIEKEAVCFYKPLPLRSLKITDLLKFTFEQLSTSDIVLYVGMMLVMALVGLLSPVFTKLLFGTVLETGRISVLIALASFMICFTLSRSLLGICQSMINSRVMIKQDIAVRAAVMSRVLSLPATFFKDYASGELTQRAMYVQTLCNTMINSIGTIGLSSVFSLIYIGQIFAYAPKLVLPAIIEILLSFVVSVIIVLRQMKITKEHMLLQSKESGMSYAMITGIQKIKLAGAEKRMFARWGRLYAKEADLQYNPPMMLKMSSALSLIISLVGSLVINYIAFTSKVSIADYYAFNTAYGMVSGAFMALAGITSIVANIKPILEMAKPIMEAVPEISDGNEMLDSVSGNIELSNVSFRYDDSMPYVLDDLSLKIKPGEYVAIVGPTGCGKSTLMRLLLGFEKPQKGTIYFDRKNIEKLDLKSLRRKIGVVMQDGKLFLGDIFSNITISAPELTLDDAWKAAEIAAIADDIRAMPMGMHTIISEGQGGISGGQRQRLMIARAVAPNPKILMFDEATSALDNITQKKVSEAIDSLNCTRIVIAHRLSTIRHCDRIVVLNGGKIVEDGNYEELTEKNGFFAELVRRQRLDVDD